MKFVTISLLAFLAIATLELSANAATVVPFSDSVIYWPTFSDPANPHNQNNTDVIGDPDITGGNFIYTGHTLSSISLNYKTTSNVLIPADWFFDFNNDGKWDYTLHNSNTKAIDYDKPDSYTLYDVTSKNLSITEKTNYTLSSWPNRYYGRDNHPVALSSDALSGLTGKAVTFSGWDASMPVDGPATWSNLGIDLEKYSGKTFTYAFAMLCANDVIYGASTVPTPEPGTMLLMGIGAAGAAFMRRRTKRS